MVYFLDIIEMDLSELKPAEYNPNYMDDDELKKLDKSLCEFGFVDPIIYHVPTKIIIGGHQRQITKYAQGKKRGFSLILGDIGWFFTDQEIELKDDNKIKALNLALNKIKGQFDQVKLESLFHGLKLEGFDTSLTGFDNVELLELETNIANKKEIIEDNYDPDEADIEPRVKKGDLWQLGRHFLFCGDATNTLEMDDLMNGKKANLIITDPPYNVDYTGGTPDQLKIKNDKMDTKAFYQFLLESFTNIYQAAADGASIYIFHADTEGLNFRKAFTDSGFRLAQCCVWAKQSIVMGRQDYHWQHEPILYGWKPTSKHHWYSDRKQSTLWNYNKPQKNKEHPTMKPIELIAYPIKNSSQINDIILDPFGGSGSTLIACEQLQRTCHTMELDPHYCDVIINRWEQFTGNKAEISCKD